MKTLTLEKLANCLAELTPDFLKRTTVEEHKKILANTDKLLELIHGKRSFNVLNYEPLPIETELAKKINVLRVDLLKKMLQFKSSFSLKPTEECFENFHLAHKLNYGSYKTDGSGWNHSSLASRVQNMFFIIIVENLTKHLSSGNLPANKKIDALKMLNGLQARYNGSEIQYQEAYELLKRFDHKKEIIDTFVYT